MSWQCNNVLQKAPQTKKEEKEKLEEKKGIAEEDEEAQEEVEKIRKGGNLVTDFKVLPLTLTSWADAQLGKAGRCFCGRMIYSHEYFHTIKILS